MMPEYYYEYDRDDADYFIKENVCCDEHIHKSIELLYCVSGEREVFVDGEHHILRSGDLVFVPPFTVHKFSYDKSGGDCYCCILPIGYSDIYKKKTDDRRFLNLVFENSPKIDDVRNHLAMLYTADDLLKQGVYSYVLSRLITNTPLSDKKEINERAFAVKAISYISQHYCEDINLESISNALGYNRCYFSTTFNKHFRTNFSLFLNNLRINRSIPMLKDETVAVVAQRVGFNNIQSYFKNFKRVTGTTPKNYIKEHFK